MGQNSLKISEAYARDIGNNIVRMDYGSMDMLGASTGDIIEIKGRHRTVAKCRPLYTPDEDKGIVKIDELGRENLGAAIGDTVTLKKVSVVAAEKVAVVPMNVAAAAMNGRDLSHVFEAVPLTGGAKVMTRHAGDSAIFRVASVMPEADAVLVTPKTSFSVSSLAVAATEPSGRGL
ncbi:MAG: hypothetical protein J4F28_09340 [Nitrosopumilaceae archaeon]|nr:hypothetical protein [Nitrosopumilaceae archaeon]